MINLTLEIIMKANKSERKISLRKSVTSIHKKGKKVCKTPVNVARAQGTLKGLRMTVINKLTGLKKRVSVANFKPEMSKTYFDKRTQSSEYLWVIVKTN